MRIEDLIPLTPPVCGPEANLALDFFNDKENSMDRENPLEIARQAISRIMFLREQTQLDRQQNRFNRGESQASRAQIEELNSFLDIASQIVLSEGISFSE